MWGMDYRTTERIVLQFSSMSLGRISVQKNDEGMKDVGLLLHDLHLGFCRHQVLGKWDKEKWHLRLLLSTEKEIDWRRYFATKPDFYRLTKTYICRNHSRHLLEVGAIDALWALIVDPQWVYYQLSTGGRIGLRRDFQVLLISLRKNPAIAILQVIL